jgi:hypothetical protein
MSWKETKREYKIINGFRTLIGQTEEFVSPPDNSFTRKEKIELLLKLVSAFAIATPFILFFVQQNIQNKQAKHRYENEILTETLTKINELRPYNAKDTQFRVKAERTYQVEIGKVRLLKRPRLDTILLKMKKLYELTVILEDQRKIASHFYNEGLKDYPSEKLKQIADSAFTEINRLYSSPAIYIDTTIFQRLSDTLRISEEEFHKNIIHPEPLLTRRIRDILSNMYIWMPYQYDSVFNREKQVIELVAAGADIENAFLRSQFFETDAQGFLISHCYYYEKWLRDLVDLLYGYENYLISNFIDAISE